MCVAAGRRGCCARRSQPTPMKIQAQPVEEGPCGGLPGVCVWRPPRGEEGDGLTCWGGAEILNDSRRPRCKPFPTEKKVKAGLKVLSQNLAHRGAQSMDGNSLREGRFSLQTSLVPESGVCQGVGHRHHPQSLIKRMATGLPTA